MMAVPFCWYGAFSLARWGHGKPTTMAMPRVVAENRSTEASRRSFIVVVFCLRTIIIFLSVVLGGGWSAGYLGLLHTYICSMYLR